MIRLKVHLLGAPLVEHEDRDQEKRVVDIQRRKAQALLFYLALVETPPQRETLAALLWPEHDHQRSQGALRRHLSELNAMLGGGWIAAGQATVTLTRAAELWVDVHAFQQFLAVCQTHGHNAQAICPACIPPLTNAVALYRADFLDGFTLPDAPAFDEWQFFQSEALRQRYATALEQLVQAHVANNDAAAAIPHARRSLQLDTLHEPAHRQLMHLYATTGQQSAALRQYAICVQTLREEFDVAPAPETTALYEQIRQGDLPAQATHDRRGDRQPMRVRHNLPASTTPFVGRVQAQAELVRLCDDTPRRLITILGPGGIGKTRIALEIAAQLVARQPESMVDGVFFVRLAQLTDPANIIQAIAIALNLQFYADGRSSQQQLFDYLRHKHMFLVLDNVEHLLGGVEIIHELLQNCPLLRLLATSRERLHLMGETVFTLGNLDFPTWELPQQVEQYEAVRLFIDSAQRVHPQPFLNQPSLAQQSLHDEEILAIARICRLVGGMPLGIILAASWMEVLSPAEIAAELAQGFDWLETELRDLPERQRSMAAVMDYSWQRLTAAEQSVFMRLALFRGGFTRTAAAEIAGASLSTLARLVDKSFVQRTGDKRYDIHELLRQYAEQQLEAAGAYPTLQHAHGTYYLNFLHEYEAKMQGSAQMEAILQLEADFENVRAAWLWAVQTHNYARIDHALNALFHWFFWLRRSRQQEGLALLHSAQQAWASSPEAIVHPVWGRIQARLLEQQGPWFDKPVETRARIENALAIAQQHEDEAEIYFCTWALGLALVSEGALMTDEGDTRRAIQCFEQCVAAFRASGNEFWLAQALEKLAHTYRRLDICDPAVPLLEESLALRRKLGDRVGIARTLRELAWTRFNQGLEQPTLDTAEAAYALEVELGDQQGIADSGFLLALFGLSGGNWQRAKTLLVPVQQYATEMNVALYQRWSAICMMLAQYMEENVQLYDLPAPSFPNHFCAYTTRLYYLLYSVNSHEASSQTGHFLGNLQKLLALAHTNAEFALCLLFGAHRLAYAGDHQRATLLLALALTDSDVAQSWLLHLPMLATLQAELRAQMSPAEFADAWQQGQTHDVRQAAAELSQTLANQKGQSATAWSYSPKSFASD